MKRSTANTVGLLVAAMASCALGQSDLPPAPQFGVRFQPQNFDPVEFRGFSFAQPTFRAQFGGPIQFRQITFPSLSSTAVRREFVERSRQRGTRNDLLDERTRAPSPIRTSTSATRYDSTVLASRSRADVASSVRGGEFATPGRGPVVAAVVRRRIAAAEGSTSRWAARDERFAGERARVASASVERRAATARDPRRVVATNPARTAAIERLRR